MLGSFVGGRYLGFPSFRLLSPDPDSVCWNSLHTIRGKGYYLSVGQDLYFLGHGIVLPFRRGMLGVPVRVLFTLALLRGMSSSAATFAANVHACCSGGEITGSGVLHAAHGGMGVPRWKLGSRGLGPRGLGRRRALLWGACRTLDRSAVPTSTLLGCHRKPDVVPVVRGQSILGRMVGRHSFHRMQDAEDER